MNLQQFLLALRARFGVFVLVLSITVLAATMVSLVMPKSFKATVSLLVDAKSEQSLSNAQRPLIQPHERQSYLETQKDIITSKKVARKVVHDLKLAQDPAARAILTDEDLSAASVEERLVEALLKRLKVETSQSNVILASFASPDAALSALIANAFASAHIDTMLELHVEPARKAAAWYDEQLARLRTNLEEAQAKLTDSYRRSKIVSVDERQDVEHTRLGALSDEALKAQAQALQWGSREQQVQQVVKRGASPDRLPDVLDNPFIQRLKGDLLQGESRLEQLATQFGRNHPQVERQVSENRSLRQRLNAEMAKIVAGIETSARQSRQREASLGQALTAQRTLLLGLKDARNELGVLRRNVESAERAYDTALQRSVTSQVESRANQSNVAVLSPAVMPDKPFSPRIALNVALSVLVGVMLGVGVVMLLEMTDRRVRSLADLESAWNVPVLGELKPSEPTRRLSSWTERANRALPSPG